MRSLIVKSTPAKVLVYKDVHNYSSFKKYIKYQINIIADIVYIPI